MSFINSFTTWVRRLLMSRTGKMAVKVVDILKRAVQSPYALVVTDIIPGDVDATVLRFIREYLPKVALTIAITNEDYLQKTPEEIVLIVVDKIRSTLPPIRAEIYQKIAALLYKYAEDSQIDVAEAVKITQEIYKILKENNEVA